MEILISHGDFIFSPSPRSFQAGSDGSYAISFINQRPNTSFTCSVRALNMFGASPAATAKGSTLPRSSESIVISLVLSQWVNLILVNHYISLIPISFPPLSPPLLPLSPPLPPLSPPLPPSLPSPSPLSPLPTCLQVLLVLS